MLVSVSSGQTSTNSTDDRARLVSLCEQAVKEVKASRALIPQLEESLKAKEKQIAVAEKLQTASDEQVGRLKAESDLIRQSLEAERTALKESEAAVAEYKKALAKMTKKKNFFKSMTKILAITTVIAGGIAAALILKD